MADSYSADDVKALVSAAIDRFAIAVDEANYNPVNDMQTPQSRHEVAKKIATRLKGYLETIGTDLDDLAFAEFSLPPGDSKKLDTVPRDGTPFYVHTVHSFRWTPYKSEGTAKAGSFVEKLPNGVYGRWQVYDENGHGGWVNCLPPIGFWRK